MDRQIRIKQLLKDWEELSPSLKKLTKSIIDDYRNEISPPPPNLTEMCLGSHIPIQSINPHSIQ